jgi:hypothetical protein
VMSVGREHSGAIPVAACAWMLKGTVQRMKKM